MQYVASFADISSADLAKVGGKNASLGEMINQLSDLGIKVPEGFATTVVAYHEFLRANDLERRIFDQLNALDVENVKQLKQTGSQIREWILQAKMPEGIAKAIRDAYRQLNLSSEHSVAVRSSATAEDLPEASFAGQQETFLNISGEEHVLQSIKQVYASLFTNRAIAYRVHHGFAHDQVAISAGVQRMIRSDLAASGVIFTLDTESGFDQVIFITAAYGLGESIVQGAVNPDEFYVHKPTLQKGYRSIIARQLGSKAKKLIYAGADCNDRLKQVNVSADQQQVYCLQDDEVLELARQALAIEQHYGKPMDIEWAKDGVDNQLYMIQARPETVKAQAQHGYIEQYQLIEETKPITQGRSVGQKIGQGKARVIESADEMERVQKGDILVTDMTDPDWEPIMKRAGAIVTNRGGRTCHAAIIARELGIPAVVGCHDATETIKDDDPITVCCANGETGYIYPGLLKFEVEKIEIGQLPKLPIQICMNLANPEQAFSNQFIPNDGIGLARLEFIISNMIGIHPNATLAPEKLSTELQEELKNRTSAYASPKEFYTEKLAEGVATIAAAFYPKPIIVRFSDFKSNEYANLLGGKQFEPHEENPMIGYRGAARYLSGDFAECFALECEAIKRVREQKGLDNTHVMFPFVRTVAQARELMELIQSYGLERGKNGLKVFMMCEIPSNVLLVDEFLPYFDGYSIGSNDLTQLTLGLDRDSELISQLFDERDASVKTLLQNVIRKCRQQNKYVGICGQAPSDHIDFAKWLMDEGISSMSLTPDSVIRTWLALSEVACEKEEVN